MLLELLVVLREHAIDDELGRHDPTRRAGGRRRTPEDVHTLQGGRRSPSSHPGAGRHKNTFHCTALALTLVTRIGPARPLARTTNNALIPRIALGRAGARWGVSGSRTLGTAAARLGTRRVTHARSALRTGRAGWHAAPLYAALRSQHTTSLRQRLPILYGRCISQLLPRTTILVLSHLKCNPLE